MWAHELRNRIKRLPREAVDWEKFDIQFKAAHPDFIRSLTQRAPDLTVTEVRICTMLRMNLKSHEIASVFFITEKGVEFHRVNIRQKLGLRKEEKLPLALGGGGCEGGAGQVVPCAGRGGIAVGTKGEQPCALSHCPMKSPVLDGVARYAGEREGGSPAAACPAAIGIFDRIRGQFLPIDIESIGIELPYRQEHDQFCLTLVELNARPAAIDPSPIFFA